MVVSDGSITATVNIAAGAAAGARNVTVTGIGGTSNAVTFTVTVPPAGLFSIAPNTGDRGTAQPVVLTGISLTGATAVNVTGGGIAVSGLTVVSDTQVNVTFTITPTAALTARNVTVTTPAGTTTPVTFTVVNPGTPIINSITPASGLRRTAAAANPVTVTLTGTNFTAGSTVNVVPPANGLTITGVTRNATGTSITATFNTTTAAAIGPRSITVTNPGGTSNAVTYTVLGPVLTSITPTSGLRGQGAISVSIYGSGLTGATAVTVPGGSVTVGPIMVVGDTQINTTFTFTTTAALTARAVTVTAPGGVSNSVAFTVTAPATPTLASIAPPSGGRATIIPVTLTGTNFPAVGPVAVAVSGAGVTVSGVAVTSPTTINATFTISATATLGAHNVSVTVAGAAAASNTVPFTVLGASVTSISPNSGLRGTATLPVTFTGANLTGTTAISGLGGGVSLVAGSLTVASATQVNATLAISATATLGIHNLGLTTPIGATNTLPFTVTGATISAPAPALATTPANTTTETGTITVTANGAQLTLSATPTIAKVGGAGGTFSITGGTCVSGTAVAAGNTCTIIVQYAPGTSTATATANVTITGTGASGTGSLTSANFTAN
jgi:hypothetical protein